MAIRGIRNLQLLHWMPQRRIHSQFFVVTPLSSQVAQGCVSLAVKIGLAKPDFLIMYRKLTASEARNDVTDCCRGVR